MFWNNAKTTTDAAAWGTRLEAGDQSEPTLAIAAQLSNLQIQSTAPNPFFKARLRQQLLTLHATAVPTGGEPPNQRPQPRLGRRERWLLVLVTVAALGGYWQRFWLAGLFTAQVDDWPYGLLALLPVNPILLEGASVPLKQILPPLVGSIGVLCLIYGLLRQLGNWCWPHRAQPVAWTKIAYQGIWISTVASVLLAGVSLYVVQHSLTTARFGRAVPSSLIRAPVPAAAPAVKGPTSDLMAAIADQPAAASAPQALTLMATPAALAAASAEVQPAAVGLAAGGAKDVNNFRENIAQNYLPLATDITVEGLFYDYYFATGQQAPCAQLFCPSYTQAYSRDPISGEPQHFLAVGLNSGLSAADVARKRLNLVVVLDISGSMGEEFTRYYYDNSATSSPLDWEAKPKIQAATEAIAGLLDQLAPEDQLAIVLFDDQAHLAKAMRLVGETDLASIKQHVLALQEQGGTNLEAGYRMGSDLLAPFVNADPAHYENRIIFLTDAQPNTGATSEAALLALTQANAAQRIYTTFIGVGVDFNTALVEGLTKIRGANYYAVHSPVDFLRRLHDEFAFMVTPLLFDLTLTFNSPDFVIEQVYGSPEADQASGEIMRINTLFPAASRGGEVKGGLVLLQLRPRHGNPAPTGQATLTVTYADRSGAVQSSAATVNLAPPVAGQGSSDRYDNPGIRKGILLVRYANLLRNWINDTRSNAAGGDEWLYPSVNQENGIILPQAPALGEWERQSLPLQVSPAYRTLFAQFKAYFATEMNGLADETLQQELTVLERLAR